MSQLYTLREDFVTHSSWIQYITGSNFSSLGTEMYSILHPRKRLLSDPTKRMGALILIVTYRIQDSELSGLGGSELSGLPLFCCCCGIYDRNSRI